MRVDGGLRRSVGLFRHFLAAYPGRSAAMLLALTAAALAEGVGVAALLPVVGLVIGAEGDGGALAAHVDRLFALLGLDLSLGALLAAIVAAIALKSLLTLLAMTQVGYSAARVATDQRLALVRALMKARWPYFADRRAGALASAAGGEPARAARAYVDACRVLSAAVQLLVYLALAIAISWEISLAAVAVGALGAVALSGLVAMSRDAGRNQTERQKSFMSRLLQALDGMKTLKAMALEDGARPLIEKEVSGLGGALRKIVVSQEALAESHEILRVLGVAGVLYAFVAIWDLPAGSLLVLALIFVRILQKAGQLQGSYQSVATNQPAFAFVRSTIAAAEAEREPDLGAVALRPASVIELRDVSFAYGRGTVLDRVSMTLPVGAFVSVVGASGAGKTTVADLVIGLLRPRSGEVWIDDVPMRDIDARAWRGAIGYVPQDTFLFHDTIAANVALGAPGADRDRVETALRRAGAWDFVAALPDGADTVVGERGARLSGGQRQRVAIARALARDPALLILDEATTALDPETEAGVVATVRRLAEGGLTVLAISHQPAMRDAADVVYRLDKGRAAPEHGDGRPETGATGSRA